ncbi:hypothetical protein DYB32_003795 [Aphanomyces invadans]|uniref:Uncharacterized protein n=1 Tax=Aphanomyces invadans TaxID=157072 RepID=A0A3R7D2E0_9STRA|nr:hypothetical protein DYB32_003795 [Aphanomyces invadans]
MDESVWESVLMRFSPQQILCASFAGIFVLTLAFAYVVVDPTLSTRPYKNLSVQYTAWYDKVTPEIATHWITCIEWSHSFDDSTYTPPKDDELIKRCSLRDIDREIHLSQTQDTHATSSLHRRKHDRFEGGNEDEIKAPLQTMHNILTYFKAPPTRDINQVSIFCKALVKHDGLDLLQTLVQTSADPDVQAIAQAIIEEAVPSIWC